MQRLTYSGVRLPAFGLVNAWFCVGGRDATLMTTVQDRDDSTLSAATSRKAPGLKPVLLIAATVLVLTLAGSIWLYQDGTRAIRVQAKVQGVSLDPNKAQSADAPISKVLKQVDDWALRMIMATAAGGAGVLLATLVGVSWWRRA